VGGAGRGGSSGAACHNDGGRLSVVTAGPPPCAGVVPAPTANAGDAAAPPLPLGASTAPARLGGFRHSRPLGLCGSSKPGGNVGRAGIGGWAVVGFGVAGVDGAGSAPVAASAADGLARGAAGGSSTRSAAGRVVGAADGSPSGLWGVVAGDVSFSVEWDVAPRDPVGDGGTAGGAPGMLRPACVGDADDGRRGRNVGEGAGTAGPPARLCEPSKRRARPPRLPGGPYGGTGLPRPECVAGDSRPGATRRFQRVARGTVPPCRLHCASGDLICRKRNISIGS